MKKVTFSTSNYKPLDIATSKRVDGRYFTIKKLKFEVVIAKVAIYVLTEVRQGVEVAIGSAAAISKVAISNGHCIKIN